MVVLGDLMEKEYMIETRDLTKRFGDVVAVDSLNMHVNKIAIHP